jgi:hypothetical protein
MGREFMARLIMVWEILWLFLCLFLLKVTQCICATVLDKG